MVLPSGFRVAEREGFEPPVAQGHNGFRDRPVQPGSGTSPEVDKSMIENLIQINHRLSDYRFKAERQGFEPWEELLTPHTISSRAPSASRSSLQVILLAQFLKERLQNPQALVRQNSVGDIDRRR